MAASTSKAVRDGRTVEVKSQDLVVGDIILLEAGDAVPADCRVLESASMKIEEAALTGESVPVEKHVDALAIADGDEDVALGDRINMCYMGSTVVYGRGRAVVVACGMDTEMGKIADAITEAKDEMTPLQVKLAELSKILTILVVIICAVIFGVGFIKHGSEFLANPELILNTFMVAVSLAVAAIPEGLVAVVTIVLSIGVTKMSHHNAIIRKLTAVETLGCTQLVCSDKTGTLTQNRMTVTKHATENIASLVCAMALASDAEWDSAEGVAKGEPTEAALVADAAKEGFAKGDLEAERHRIGEAPFDSGRKMMSVVTKGLDGRILQHTKGAPDEVLKRCTTIQLQDKVAPLTDEMRADILAANKGMADQALRVLAAARREWDEAPEDFSAANLEHDLTYLGLCGMIDPVRPEVAPAIQEAHEAGIRVVMITGDHIDTAVAIAKELGIITDASQAITGAQLDRISDEELESEIERYGVYARVQPEHKVRIVEAWKKKDKIVAMTGDGVNDAPSIKRADIGIGMGITGTDVTKNVADMVLADDNFATIIKAVEEGRKIYDNIRKAIQFLLSSNLAEVICVFVATMVGFTILEPVHLLWINLITDCFPALALGMEHAEPGIMRRKPRDSKDGVFAGGMGVDCAFQGIVISILTLVSYFIGHSIEYGTMDISNVIADPTAGMEGMTMAFLTLSMVEMFHSFNMRSRRQSVFKLGRQNVWLWGSFGLSLLLTWLVVEVDPVASVFGFAQLDPSAYGIAMALAFLVIPLNEVYKAIMRSVERKQA
jgi:Ca2+-transporting ATPase